MDKQTIKTAKKAAEELLSLLEVTAPLKIEEAEEGIEITIETEEENGILIGYHGETLEALQLILSLCIAKKLGSFVRVSLEVGSYKKSRMEYLQNLVTETKNQVITEGKSVSLPSLKSWERRFVHMLLKEDEQVISESSGEGRDRVLVIYPKQ